MKVVKYHRCPLSRQVGEAIRIRRRGLATLNSRGEYNRCSIQRLSLGNESESDPKHDNMVDQNAMERGEEDTTIDWTTGMLDKRDKRDQMDRVGLGRAEPSMSSKRKGEDGATKSRKSKKKRYEVMGDDWGQTEDEEKARFLQSGLEGVPKYQKCKGALKTTSISSKEARAQNAAVRK